MGKTNMCVIADNSMFLSILNIKIFTRNSDREHCERNIHVENGGEEHTINTSLYLLPPESFISNF